MINPMDMTEKHVIVTGASSGIGQETAVLLSQLGAKIILVARNVERLEQTARMLEGDGHGVEPFDLSRADEIPLWMKGLTKKYQPLDGVVHSAGLQLSRPVRDWKAEDCDMLMKVNLYPCFALARGLRQKGVHADGASLVFVSSAGGLVGLVGLSIYVASKAGVIGLTRTLALELVRDGIRVNVVAPGSVHTEMIDGVLNELPADFLDKLVAKHPLGLGTPRDVAHAVAFLLAETGRWITGTTLVVDGGYTAQ